MNESFEDRRLRIYNSLQEFAKKLNLDFVNIDIEVVNPTPSLLSLEILVRKDKEQLVAEKLMEDVDTSTPSWREGGYVKPKVTVVEYALNDI